MFGGDFYSCPNFMNGFSLYKIQSFLNLFDLLVMIYSKTERKYYNWNT